MKFMAVALVLLVFACTAVAADVDGKWVGNVSTPNGDFPMSFTFKADGATLTGSMAGMDGMDNPIKDGKVDGANIAFSVDLDFGGQAVTLNYKGVVTAEEIKFEGEAGGQVFELVVKKQKTDS
jgi:opacity protein-like surface antigen